MGRQPVVGVSYNARGGFFSVNANTPLIMFRYSKQFESDSRYRDAEIILLLERRQKELPTERGLEVFEEAVDRYLKKHNQNWVNFVPAIGREIGI